MKRFIIKIMEFLTLFYAVMLVGTIIVDQLAVPYFIPVKKYIFRGLVIIAFVLVFIEMVIDFKFKSELDTQVCRHIRILGSIDSILLLSQVYHRCGCGHCGCAGVQPAALRCPALHAEQPFLTGVRHVCRAVCQCPHQKPPDP